jgi:DNA-binding transcriptional regulator GbsR (MarR family)
MDDKKTNELMAKCEENRDDPALMKECKEMLNTMAEKNVEIEDMPNQSYTNMAENISAEDVPKVLEMALKIAKSGNIKDTEVKIAAEKLIRTLEPL